MKAKEKKNTRHFNYQLFYRRTALIIYDILSVTASSFLAILLRYDMHLDEIPDQFLMHLLPAFLVYPFNVDAISLVNSMYSFARLLLFLYAITGALLSCDHSIPLSTRM